MFSPEELKKLEALSLELRMLVLLKDESEEERNIKHAIVYLDCARHNIVSKRDGLSEIFIVAPSLRVLNVE